MNGLWSNDAARNAWVHLTGTGWRKLATTSDAVHHAMLAELITAWHNGKKITAMWANASVRNAHASIVGMGWKRLSNANDNDSSFLALTMMASHAEQTNANCNIRVESDGEIHEIYVW